MIWCVSEKKESQIIERVEFTGVKSLGGKGPAMSAEWLLLLMTHGQPQQGVKHVSRKIQKSKARKDRRYLNRWHKKQP